ncbi:HipA N-terminal domain-containing protein [bacterium RCC_150]
MSTRELHVYLDGESCGVLQQTHAGNLTFSYDDSYRTGPHPTPLSLSMPMAVKVHKKRAIPPFLQGLLPDREEALRPSLDDSRAPNR